MKTPAWGYSIAIGVAAGCCWCYFWAHADKYPAELFADSTASKCLPGRIYSNESIDDLVHLMYRSAATPSGVARAFLDPQMTRAWNSLDDTFTYHDAVQAPAESKITKVHFPVIPLESFGLMAISGTDRAQAFMQLPIIDQIEELVAKIVAGEKLFESITEKALLQRDLLQIYSIFVVGASHLKEPDLIAKAGRLADNLSRVLQRLILSQSEFIQLTSSQRQHSSLARFRQENAFDLAGDYLPAQVVEAEQNSWWPVAFHMKYHVHYGKYRGRSFFHGYVRIPGMSHQKFRELWHLTATRTGAVSNAETSVLALPEGSQTMLIRTMGVLLDDGSMADSSVVEEVLLRGFCAKKAEFLPETSDFRGTVHFQYVLDRARYLRHPHDIGLVRIHDDDPSYVGFFPCAPDTDTSMNEYILPSRFNCINCHSETFHGLPTVFSLGFEEVANLDHLYDGHPFAALDQKTGRVRLSTLEVLSLLSANHK